MKTRPPAAGVEPMVARGEPDDVLCTHAALPVRDAVQMQRVSYGEGVPVQTDGAHLGLVHLLPALW